MNDIWSKCPKTTAILKLERRVREFLEHYHMTHTFTVEQIENWIYHCPARGEEKIFDPILDRMKGCGLKDLAAFDTLFRTQFFPYIPQRILNGLSPVKYALLLKRCRG